jgi:tagatose 6-phosphate kinase
MILTVTLNFALDTTYHVAGFERGHTTRVETVARRAGGKGVNVARVLHQLGREAIVTGVAGGFTGLAGRAELRAAGLRDELVEIGGQSRLTIVVVDHEGTATGFSEPGPVVTPEEWEVARSRLQELMGSASAVVLSGSLPPGVPTDAYRQLIDVANRAGVPVLLDAENEALKLGVAAHPAIVKINAAELSGVTGERDVEAGARALQSAGAQIVVITEGSAGLMCFGQHTVLRAAPPQVLTGNPTGAGDAASAALAVGLLDGLSWPERLADAAALSAAAVHSPMAGSFDANVYRRFRAAIQSAAS